MTLKRTAAAALGLIISAAGSAAWADDPTLTWGVFRENIVNVSDAQKNCWSQAMASGETINGELLNSNLSESDATLWLLYYAWNGQCASDRQSSNWVARCDAPPGTQFGDWESYRCGGDN